MDYYRKIFPKSALPAWLKKFLKSNWVRFFLVAGIPIMTFMTFNNKGLLQHQHLRQEKREMMAKIAAAQNEQRILQQQSKALDNDPFAIEKVAREKYGMIKEGETVYKVRKDAK